jgi:type IV pilus assembly protein PilX
MIARHSQRGSILIITIMLLLMVTVLAVGAMSLNSSQTRMATNTADAQIAFQAAEGALNQVTANLLNNGSYASADYSLNAAGLYTFDPTIAPRWTSLDFTSTAALQSFQGSSNTPASFIIEKFPLPQFSKGNSFNDPSFSAFIEYRVTTRAVGPSGGSEVKLQGVVVVPYVP